MIKRRTKHGILFLSLLAATSWLLARKLVDENDGPVSRVDTRLNYALEEFSGRLLNEQGEMSLEIFSPMLRKNAESEVGTIESPEIRIRQENDQWYIKADSAIISADREYVSLTGSVYMNRRNQVNGDNMEINTSDVTLEVTPRLATTDSQVTIRQFADELRAVGMKLDMINDRYELLDEVQARYDLP